VSQRAGYILAGGRSSRFGRDKALVEMAGRPLILHVAERAREVCEAVTIVGPPQRYAHLNLRVIGDAIENAGPLGGIATALEDSASPWNLIVACDMPFLCAAVLDLLFDRAGQRAADVILPLSSTGLEEPLCAIYAKSAGPTLRAGIEAGTRKITEALAALRVERVESADYRHLDPSGRHFLNLNTPADWPEGR
jgi:molybdopterin-guanine dinucleotide biosynthesis protein A